MEQKNYSGVRKHVGYMRYDTEEELRLLKDLYGYLRPYTNFFQPVMKQVSKERVGSKVIKRYDMPQKPYHRVLESPYVSDARKEELRRLYEKLNPAELYREIVRLQNRLIEMVSLKEEIRKSQRPNRHKKGNPCYAYV